MSSCSGGPGCPRRRSGSCCSATASRSIRAVTATSSTPSSPTAGRCTGSTSAGTGCPAVAAPTSIATTTSSSTSTSSAVPSSPAIPAYPWYCSGTAWAARSRWLTRWSTRPISPGSSCPRLRWRATSCRSRWFRCYGRWAGSRRGCGPRASTSRRSARTRPSSPPTRPTRWCTTASRRSRLALASSASSPCCPSGRAELTVPLLLQHGSARRAYRPCWHPPTRRHRGLGRQDRALVRRPLARDLQRAGARPAARRSPRVAGRAPLNVGERSRAGRTFPWRLPAGWDELARGGAAVVLSGHVTRRRPRRDLGHPPRGHLRPVVSLELTSRPVRSPHRWSSPCCSHAPTSFALADLTDLTRVVADEVRAGRHPVHIDPLRRWYQLLRGDDFVDVWLISWATSQAAELHDHAGSLGALTVVSGRLVEQRWTGTGCAPVAAGGPQRGVPARARARRGEPGGRARRERARLLAAAHGDVVLRRHAGRAAAAHRAASWWRGASDQE